jgi:nucleotide-binding universal stress UspA family protein
LSNEGGDAMTTKKTILVALDDSEASQRVLSYTAEQAKASDGLHLLLCHVLPPMPPQLLESRGAENPDDERRVESQQEKEQLRWTAEQTRTGERMLADGQQRLTTLGVAATRIRTKLVEPAHTHLGVADAILETAREAHCDAIVVGRHAFSALREMLHTHLADVLQENAKQLEVRIVD